jgi:hypothetical protein
MAKIFVGGSISIKDLDPKVCMRIDNIAASNHTVIVGDSDGADSAIQEYLLEKGASHTVIYCSGDTPRNNIGWWPVNRVQVKHAAPSSRAFFRAKDVEMAKVADFGVVILDAKSTGTLRNVIELLRRKKKSVVFVRDAKKFQTVGDVTQFESLLKFMSEPALRNAKQELRLRRGINELRQNQFEILY